jgi:hypothetical protein
MDVKTLTTAQQRRFVAASRWTFAWTQRWWPHDYTTRAWAQERGLESDFEAMVMTIRARGFADRFGRRTFVYLALDGFRFWSMGNPLPETTVLNRARIDAEGRLIREDGTLLRSPRTNPAQLRIDIEVER